MNRQIAHSVRLGGRVLDVGGGSRPSYWRFLSHIPANAYSLVGLDLDVEKSPDICGSVESIPLRSMIIGAIHVGAWSVSSRTLDLRMSI